MRKILSLQNIRSNKLKIIFLNDISSYLSNELENTWIIINPNSNSHDCFNTNNPNYKREIKNTTKKQIEEIEEVIDFLEGKKECVLNESNGHRILILESLNNDIKKQELTKKNILNDNSKFNYYISLTELLGVSPKDFLIFCNNLENWEFNPPPKTICKVESTPNYIKLTDLTIKTVKLNSNIQENTKLIIERYQHSGFYDYHFDLPLFYDKNIRGITITLSEQNEGTEYLDIPFPKQSNVEKYLEKTTKKHLLFEVSKYFETVLLNYIKENNTDRYVKKAPSGNAVDNLVLKFIHKTPKQTSKSRVHYRISTRANR
jgi:hypothetical protein